MIINFEPLVEFRVWNGEYAGDIYERFLPLSRNKSSMNLPRGVITIVPYAHYRKKAMTSLGIANAGNGNVFHNSGYSIKIKCDVERLPTYEEYVSLITREGYKVEDFDLIFDFNRRYKCIQE